ncbi:MAG: hypothetical protein IJ180_07920 [Bacteroidales bacterium]|nr:hypothetical protein [Bacteroidales bacterium]
MSRLYLFAIGGTGSRVLRSLTMMLSCGVDIGIKEIVPIIIDPDVSNASLTKTVSLMNKYSSIREKLSFGDSNGFFGTEINQILPNYTLPIRDTDNKRFDEFICYSSMSKTNQAMTSMLFSDENLSSSMEVGFKGNPNIGSVVLNQIAVDSNFLSFAQSFSQGDKIFIISSIFGGTGASGFPLLLKTLRTSKQIPNHNLINNAEIGALSILPYFKVDNTENKAIDSSSFISKTKSALAYYEKNVIGNGSINAMYFLADADSMNTYSYSEGGGQQDNAAHLIEFFGATAIIDFAKNNYATKSENLELGLENYENDILFKHIPDGLKKTFKYPMAQMLLFNNYLTYNLDGFKNSKCAVQSLNLTEGFYTSPYFNNVKGFLSAFKIWLKEMRNNKRSLKLFNLEKPANPFDIITEEKPKSSSIFGQDNYETITSELNKQTKNKNIDNTLSLEDRFMRLFYAVTKKLIEKRIGE